MNNNKICQKCGKELEDNKPYCPNCGAPVSGEAKSVNSINNKKNNSAVTILVTVFFILIFSFVYSEFVVNNLDNSNYDTTKVYEMGETFKCQNFEITVNEVKTKKKGSRIDSYYVVADPEWIAVILTVTNTSNSTEKFYTSDIELINSSGEIITHSWEAYNLWGAELLNSPDLVSGGTKTGFIQFSNTETDNSNLKLKIDCNSGFFKKNNTYTVNIITK